MASQSIEELRQEILCRVAAHLFQQDGPAMDNDNNCMYRAPDGNCRMLDQG